MTLRDWRAALGAAAFLVVTAACASDEPEMSTQTSALVDPYAFVLPVLTQPQRAQIVDRYSDLDPNHEVPRALLEDAIVYFDVNQAQIPRQQYIAVADFSLYSGKDRFWLVDLTTGAVEKHKVAHGDGSDPDNDGYPQLFGNVDGSHMTSLGFYLTGEIYDGTHPHSMRLDGLSPDGSPNGMANSNVRDRLIVVHEASYVADSNTNQQGRSNGCPALDPGIEVSVVDRVHDGTLMYAATTSLAPPVGAASCGNKTCETREDQFTCPEDCGVCGVISTGGGVIDDSDACFATGGPTSRLHQVKSSGVNDTLVWTSATALAAEQSFADWSFNFASSGRYRVEVFTAGPYAEAHQATYVIRANGVSYQTTLDQSAHDGYQTLGEFDFAVGAHQGLHLADNTGEVNAQLVFDAVRLTRVGKGGATDDPGDDGSMIGGCSTGGRGVGAWLVLAVAALLRRRK